MNNLIRVALATLVLMPVAAPAQSAASCPGLPVDAGLKWEQLAGPGFVFCRALRSDGSEAFAVTLSADSPFEPSRVDRAEEANIGGQEVHWYRSEIAGDPDAIARETLVEFGAGEKAHISLRAASDEQKAQAMREVEALRFADARLSSN
ncbi:MAG TPA: hypothetical protein VHF86_07090, partial [Xanthomonadaceae bacterium]|nr:hypothetical protein [Xanthomonadaceae bacterium]